MNFYKLLEKLQEYFLGKSEDEVQESRTKDTPKERKVLGRIELERETSSPPVTHRYPKEGNFRFPLNVDERKPSKVVEVKVKNPPRMNESRIVQQEPEKKESIKFSGRHFQARNIPSPVYGFKEREATKLSYSTENARQQVNLDSEVLHSQTVTEEISASTEESAVIENQYIASEIEEIVIPFNKEEPEINAIHYEIEEEPIAIEIKEEIIVEKEIITINPVPIEIEKQIIVEVAKPEPINTLTFEREYNNSDNLYSSDYQFPSLDLLNSPPVQEVDDSDWLFEQADRLEETLMSFNVKASVVDVTKGPSVTRYEIQPAPGVKVSKITSLIDDIKLSLAAKDIRIEAPIPGKHAIGIEVPNLTSKPVFLNEIISNQKFLQNKSTLTVALGLDISGEPIITDLKKMPHGLVAGSTGSGKSVCINSILVSLLYKATPDEVKLMLIDPKVVELAPYNDLPHLITPVITDAKQATAGLKWAVLEMERRYELFSQKGVRNLEGYNELHQNNEGYNGKPALPYIVIVIDELADLMMVSPQEVEDAICRIAQKARACGIHLLLATQRPSVDVITGLIKANIPTRIAFSVSSQVDSRTIIDMAGAERLLGKGDMLFYENGSPKPFRVQGTFVSDHEIERVVSFVKQQQAPNYDIESEQLIRSNEEIDQDDELFSEACYFVIEQGGASASLLQRRFRVGYNRAARLIDMMESLGIVSEALGSKPRNILMSVQEFEENVLHVNKEESY